MTAIATRPTDAAAAAPLVRYFGPAFPAQLRAALPNPAGFSRFCRAFTTAVSRSPEIGELLSTQEGARSVGLACLTSAQLGLEIGVLGQAHVVKFNSKDGARAQLLIGYQGLLKLIRQSGEVTSIHADVVYRGDLFEWESGTAPALKHKPSLEGSRSDNDIIGAYAVATLRDTPLPVFEVLTRKDIDKIRNASRSGKFGPWAEWYAEMAKKSAIRRLSKRLPMDIDTAEAILTDTDRETSMLDSTPADPHQVDATSHGYRITVPQPPPSDFALEPAPPDPTPAEREPGQEG